MFRHEGAFLAAYDRPFIFDDRIIVMNGFGVICLNKTGSVLWRKPGNYFGKWVSASPSGLIVGAEDDKVLRVFDLNGDEQWHYKTRAKFIGGTFVEQDRIFIVEHNRQSGGAQDMLRSTFDKHYKAKPTKLAAISTLRCFSLDGKQHWRARFRSSWDTNLLSFGEQHVVLIAGDAMMLYDLEPNN
jgi:outer membrane protein assembly factor BamB